MLDFYFFGDDQPNNSNVKREFSSGIEGEKFKAEQVAKVVENHLDYYGELRWSNEVVRGNIAE